MSHFGAIGHHLIVAIIDDTPHGWVMFNGDMTNDPWWTSGLLYSSILLTALGYLLHTIHGIVEAVVAVGCYWSFGVAEMWVTSAASAVPELWGFWGCQGCYRVNSWWRLGLLIDWLDMIKKEHIWAMYLHFCWEPTQMNSSLLNPCDWVDCWPFLVWSYLAMVADVLLNVLTFWSGIWCWPGSSTSWHP